MAPPRLDPAPLPPAFWPATAGFSPRRLLLWPLSLLSPALTRAPLCHVLSSPTRSSVAPVLVFPCTDGLRSSRCGLARPLACGHLCSPARSAALVPAARSAARLTRVRLPVPRLTRPPAWCSCMVRGVE